MPYVASFPPPFYLTGPFLAQIVSIADEILSRLVGVLRVVSQVTALTFQAVREAQAWARVMLRRRETEISVTALRVTHSAVCYLSKTFAVKVSCPLSRVEAKHVFDGNPSKV